MSKVYVKNSENLIFFPLASLTRAFQFTVKIINHRKLLEAGSIHAYSLQGISRIFSSSLVLGAVFRVVWAPKGTVLLTGFSDKTVRSDVRSINKDRIFKLRV